MKLSQTVNIERKTQLKKKNGHEFITTKIFQTRKMCFPNTKTKLYASRFALRGLYPDCCLPRYIPLLKYG